MSLNAKDTMPPTFNRVRAYFAPVDRAAKQPTLFNAAQDGAFALNTPPAPWVDLGWISGFTRKSGTEIAAVTAGTPRFAKLQARTAIDATVHFRFESWSKLQLALSAGTQSLNLLKPATGVVAILAGSTSTVLQMNSADAATFSVGELIAVDTDYAGATGFLGSGVSGAYLKSALTDVDYTRRITLNVARIASIHAGVVTLSTPLIAGAPSTSMKASAVAGFCDREGSTFFAEWSALFVAEGQQGERVLWHYPRLQTMAGIAEDTATSSGGYDALRLAASFRALPVTDTTDGTQVVCFRSYIA